MSRYQSFSGNYPYYDNQPLSALIKVSVQDVLEDYRFSGGFRIPNKLTGSEYFLAFDDLSKRLDYRLLFYTETEARGFDFSTATPPWYNPVYGKLKTNLFEYDARYPIDYTKRINASIGFRQQKIVFQATDTFSLNQLQTPYREDWAMARVEYVFDNTIPVQLNIYDGTRYKFYFDAQKMLNQKNTMSYVLGTDIRHYLRIHRSLVLAARVSAATSFGSAKVLYYLGGVQSWYPPSFDSQTKVDDQTNYYFQALATNLRGFPQNVRNGTSYALTNLELRFPVFSYLINTPIRSEVIKNFQLVPFFDMGTAWEGGSPYSSDNPFNTNSVTQGPVNVHVNYYREPMVYGYGAGVRTMLFGYFIRLDYAWGVDSGARLSPIFYFSLSKDF